jgi:DNA-binding MarR family transcriptional regulator
MKPGENSVLHVSHPIKNFYTVPMVVQKMTDKEVEEQLDNYLDTIRMVECSYYNFLDAIKLELARLDVFDINSIQCYILYKVGNNRLTVGDMARGGYYRGSNVSYNLKKLVKNGYFIQEKSSHDQRGSVIRLSDKGHRLYDKLENMFYKNVVGSSFKKVKIEELSKTIETLHNIKIRQPMPF